MMQIMAVGKGAVADPCDGIRNGIVRPAPCGGIADQVRTVLRIQDPVQIAVRRVLRVNAEGQNMSTVSEIERAAANLPDRTRDMYGFHVFCPLKGALSYRFQAFWQLQFRKGAAIRKAAFPDGFQALRPDDLPQLLQELHRTPGYHGNVIRKNDFPDSRKSILPKIVRRPPEITDIEHAVFYFIAVHHNYSPQVGYGGAGNPSPKVGGD